MTAKKKYQKIAILIPCHNEEKGIGKVINEIPTHILQKHGFVVDIIVVDNRSTDDTVAVALSYANVRAVAENKKGKGYAIKTAFNSISSDTDYVIMMDGDNTYKSREIPRLIELLSSDFCDVVVGSRLGGKIRKHSLKPANRVANWIYTFLVRVMYRANVTDVLSGFFAWKKDVIDNLKPHLNSSGFEIEMDMITKMVKLGYELYSVPITYDMREGESKLNGFSDGFIILKTLFKNLFWKPNPTPQSRLLNPFIANDVVKN